MRVLQSGPSTLIEDLGRPGLAAQGVSPSGAMDRSALALANRLLGNDDAAAGLEVLLGGLRLTAEGPLWIAVTGAWGDVTIDAARVEPHTATPVEPGAVLSVGEATAGIRYYLAVRGGIAVEPVLGSRSRDVLAALGPSPLAAGDLLPVGSPPVRRIPPVDGVPVDPPTRGEIELALRPGPRRDWFAADAWRALSDTSWSVSARSDRTGVRLDGVALERVRSGELPSEGMLRGAIQVSPDGAPTVLGADHPVTGGYPVIAVVTDATVDRLAQARPGQPIRFTHATGHA
ncbi:biotin-dependent carboxyltransferase family protein [Lysobacter korlensis]|uniref:Biotin-dependent carboxyltransferase family protein n=1 Tax=Lysobacter korlensis TaxID=553636 RepID=A0ABV6RY85_9GAMM